VTVPAPAFFKKHPHRHLPHFSGITVSSQKVLPVEGNWSLMQRRLASSMAVFPHSLLPETNPDIIVRAVAEKGPGSGMLLRTISG